MRSVSSDSGTELLALVAEKYVPLAAKLYAEIVEVVNAINSLPSVEILRCVFLFPL